MMTSANRLFGMNMLRPKPKKGAVIVGFIRDFEHHKGTIIQNLHGEYEGGWANGTIYCDLNPSEGWTELGDNIWVYAFFGFSFADECPPIGEVAGISVNTFNRTGWYYYGKLEWWPGRNYSKSESDTPAAEEPADDNTRPTIGYENLWTYDKWDVKKSPAYSFVANGAKWVCLGIESKIFAAAKVIGSSGGSSGGTEGGDPGQPDTPGNPSGTAISWDLCTKASCWDGTNASKRMMNMLSPKMSNSKFNEYLSWMKGRGCNTAHLFVCNHKDGEYAGYSIYGSSFNLSIDNSSCNLMLSRINTILNSGLAVVLWLAADDDAGWNATMANNDNAKKYINDLHSKGFLNPDLISTVVLGLEMNEYWNSSQVSAMKTALRTKWAGMVGTHCTSGNTQFQKYGDIVFYQVAPGTNVNTIISQCNAIRTSTGKPVNMFEMERGPDRNKCVAVLNSGAAFAVGNW